MALIPIFDPFMAKQKRGYKIFLNLNILFISTCSFSTKKLINKNPQIDPQARSTAQTRVSHHRNTTS